MDYPKYIVPTTILYASNVAQSTSGVQLITGTNVAYNGFYRLRTGSAMTSSIIVNTVDKTCITTNSYYEISINDLTLIRIPVNNNFTCNLNVSLHSVTNPLQSISIVNNASMNITNNNFANKITINKVLSYQYTSGSNAFFSLIPYNFFSTNQSLYFLNNYDNLFNINNVLNNSSSIIAIPTNSLLLGGDRLRLNVVLNYTYTVAGGNIYLYYSNIQIKEYTLPCINCIATISSAAGGAG